MIRVAELAIAVLVGIVRADQLKLEEVAHNAAQSLVVVVAHAGRPDAPLDELQGVGCVAVMILHDEQDGLSFVVRSPVFEPNSKMDDRATVLDPLLELVKRDVVSASCASTSAWVIAAGLLVVSALSPVILRNPTHSKRD